METKATTRYSVGMTGIEWYNKNKEEWIPCEITRVYKLVPRYDIRLGQRRKLFLVPEEQLGERYSNWAARQPKLVLRPISRHAKLA